MASAVQDFLLCSPSKAMWSLLGTSASRIAPTTTPSDLVLSGVRVFQFIFSTEEAAQRGEVTCSGHTARILKKLTEV